MKDDNELIPMLALIGFVLISLCTGALFLIGNLLAQWLTQ
jgi:hypothetical protein